MPNYGAKILNNAVGALSAQQALIAVTSNNIANVNTPGYARRTVDLETRVTGSRSGVGDIGNGVQVGDLRQTVDTFVERLVRESTAEKGAAEAEQQFLSRAEQLFDITGNRATVGTTLTEFFTALNDMATNPSSLELRSNVIERGATLADTIKSTYNGIASLQREADTRLSAEVDAVNSLTAQIAELNALVRTREGAGGVAADERDKRELLLQRLSERISYDRVDQEDGQVLLSLKNGFPLVNGPDHRELSLTKSPSFSTNIPPALDGGALSYVVYDYSSSGSPQHVDLTEVIKDNGGGSIAGLLKVRGYSDPSDTSPFQGDGTLVSLAARVEGITRQLLSTFNAQYGGWDQDPGLPGYQPSSVDLDGNPPPVFGFFSFPNARDSAYSGTDSNGDGIIDDTYFGGSDVNQASLTDLAIVAAADGITNFSSILELTSTDPRKIAAGRDASTNPGLQLAPGDARNIMGISAADPGLAALQRKSLTFIVDGVTVGTGTFEEAYNQAVSTIGNAKAASDSRVAVSSSNLIAAQERRDEISAVSLDEEFTNLIKFQKAFEASARMLRVADELLQQIMDAL